MRMVFRSDDRSRGQTFASRADPPSAGPPQEERQGLPVAGERLFDARERLDDDGTLHLTLLGDLDFSVAEQLSSRLEELKSADRPVRLDLSQLAFIDSSGLQALLLALTNARWIGWQLEVAPELSPSVERAAQIVGIAQVLWPEERPDPRSDATQAGDPA
jgi:anti-anti-sigma factor